MPPKIRISKKNIIDTAVDIVRSNGESALNARTVAAALNCSTQPIFSNFSTMEELKFAVVEEGNIRFTDYMEKEIEKRNYPPYKATGMAYIRFAKEEKELFKLLFMRDRTSEKIPQETEMGNFILSIVQCTTGLKKRNAELFHLEMWAYVHGIATMIATDYLELPWDLISQIISDCYQGLKKQFSIKE